MQMKCWEKGLATTQMQRELQYRCSSGSGRAMGSSTGGSSEEENDLSNDPKSLMKEKNILT